MLEELCSSAGLVAGEVSFCSGVLSQKLTWMLRRLSAIHPMVAWTLVLPLRVAPPLLDWVVTPLLRWPAFSICVEATAPAHAERGGLTPGGRSLTLPGQPR